ncbi:MAG: kynureninase [Actinomycetota bacterium]|nr:kynureninase [Actinomycetota bacterium]
MDRDQAQRLDAESPLAFARERFRLPGNLIYLDGNSLGALPSAVPARMRKVVESEWGTGLIGSWNEAHWMELGARVAGRLGALVGADGADIHVGDSTSVSLFKTMVAATRMRPDRRALVVEQSTFPTDGYVAAGVADLLGLELRWCDPADPVAAVDDDVAMLSLTQVDFRTGARFDMAAITAAAQDRGALVQWDLCHSVGAMPVDLTGSGADFAVGCTYKYLNGGPGSPAFLWVAPRHQAGLRPPITGWMGHAEPFAMTREWAPRDGAASMASGTPPVLALSALEAALSVFDDLDLADVRRASLSLTDLFIDLVDDRVGDAVRIVTPRDHARRGSQVSLAHPDAYGIAAALVDRGVVGDFRVPDIARFGFAPLYVRHVDVYDAVGHLVAVLDKGEHRDRAYASRNAVT